MGLTVWAQEAKAKREAWYKIANLEKENRKLREQLAKANEYVIYYRKLIASDVGNEGQLAQTAARLNELEKDVIEEIENRDNLEKWLDKLSNEIARYFGVDIGEHSSANNPWLEAFEAIPDNTLNKFAIEKKIEALRKFESISNAVANHWCDKEQKGYLWLHAEILAEIEKLEQLRK